LGRTRLAWVRHRELTGAEFGVLEMSIAVVDIASGDG
jgi:hypothetical protein